MSELNSTGGVRVEKNGPVTTVVMNRPRARNAVNGAAAAGLFAAFDEFDKDDAASVAVLWGDNGIFCAGADLKAAGPADSNSVNPTGPGPMGPSRMELSKPVIAASAGMPSPEVWSWRCGAICGWSSRMQSSGCSAGGGGCR